MHLEDLFRDSEKDLCPIFSEAMVSVIFGCLWVMATLLFLSWPYASLDRYLEDSRIPWTFFSVFAGALILSAYVNLRAGLGEILPKVVSARMDREGLTTFEEEKGYLSYTLPLSFWQTAIFLFLFLPFLLLGAMVNGIPPGSFFNALGILFSSSFLFRQAGFLLLLLWGRWRLGGYWCGRLFYLTVFLGTGFFHPPLNPLLLLFNLHFGPRVPLGPIIPSPLPYFLWAVLFFLFFSFFSWALTRKKHYPRRRP